MTDAVETAQPPMPCPDCRERGVGGGARIGNQRSTCKRCNSFAQAVGRATLTRMREKHPADWAVARAEVEADLYARLIEGGG